MPPRKLAQTRFVAHPRQLTYLAGPTARELTAGPFAFTLSRQREREDATGARTASRRGARSAAVGTRRETPR
jgi:hypothetical protein